MFLCSFTLILNLHNLSCSLDGGVARGNDRGWRRRRRRRRRRGGEGEDAPSQLHLIPPFPPSFAPLFTGSYLFSPPRLRCYSRSSPPEIYCNQSLCALPVIALRPPASLTLKASCTEQSNHHHFKRWKLDIQTPELCLFLQTKVTMKLYVALCCNFTFL